MSLPRLLVDRVINATGPLAPLPLTLPLSPRLFAPVGLVSKLVAHLTSTPVHTQYFPFLRFAAIHAARVATVLASLTRSRKPSANVGVLQDLVTYLTMAWGGASIVSLLLSQPPFWLVSGAPWIVYGLVFFLLVPTGMARYIVDTAPPLFFNVVGAFMDGMTRGTGLAAIPTTLALSPGVNSVWAHALLSGITIGGGGLLIQLLGMTKDDWQLSAPAILAGGWATYDVYAAVIVGLFHAALRRQYKELAPISDALAAVLPNDLQTSGLGGQGVVDSEHARATCVILMGALLAIKAIATRPRTKRPPTPMKVSSAKGSRGGKRGSTPGKKRKEPVVEIKTKKVQQVNGGAGGSSAEVVKTPVSKGSTSPRARTPKKSPKPRA